MTTISAQRRTQLCESSVAQILAENLMCHPSLMRWLTHRALADLSVDPTNDKTRVIFADQTANSDPGWDLKVIGDFGRIDIGFLISLRFSYRAATARKASEATKAMGTSGETAVTISVWITSQAEIDRMAGEPIYYGRTLSLESILSMLEGEARCSAYELQRRREFQIELIRSALRDATRAAEAPVDPRENFRREFLALIADEAPLLTCEDALSRPDPDFAMLIFDSSALPSWAFMPTVRLAHHLKEGYASILIHDWGEDLEGLASVMEPALDKTRYSLALAPSRLPNGKPGVLLLQDTPPLDPERTFDDQRRSARECVRLIEEMRAWFVSRKSVAGYWADFIGLSDDEANRGHNRVRRNVNLG